MFPGLQIPLQYLPSKKSQPAAETIPVNDVETPPNYSFQARCPIDFRSSKNGDEVHGIERVTRHPFLWSLGFAGFGHACRSVFVTEMIMGTFPLMFAYIGGAHQDYRHRRGSGGQLTPQRDSETSLLPFAALATGAQSWTKLVDEMKPVNAALAVALAVKLARRGA